MLNPARLEACCNPIVEKQKRIPGHIWPVNVLKPSPAIKDRVQKLRRTGSPVSPV